MAEKIKDEDDRWLDTLFAAEPIADNGFSFAIEKKIRRRQWVRRWSLPIAVLAGGAIAIRPLFSFLAALPQATDRFSDALAEFERVPLASALDLPTALTAMTSLMVLILLGRILEE